MLVLLFVFLVANWFSLLLDTMYVWFILAWIIGMKPEVYYKIVLEDFPGSDPTRGHRDIGGFHILQEFNFF